MTWFLINHRDKFTFIHVHYYHRIIVGATALTASFFCLNDTRCPVLSFASVYVFVSFLSLLVLTLGLGFELLNKHINNYITVLLLLLKNPWP
jgi:hypothetical protein